MSTYYNLKTEITLDDLRKSDYLELVEDDETYAIVDEFNNHCVLHVGNDNVIGRITRYGDNDPTLILHILIHEFDVQYLSEYDWLEKFHDATANIKESCSVNLDVDSLYEFTTRSFMEWSKSVEFKNYILMMYNHESSLKDVGVVQFFKDYQDRIENLTKYKNIEPKVVGNHEISSNETVHVNYLSPELIEKYEANNNDKSFDDLPF